MKKQGKSLFSFAREIKWSFSLAAAVELLLGLFLIFAPNTSRQVLCTLIGVVVTVYGVLNILSYVLDKGAGAFAVELLIGVIAAAFGIFALLNPDFIVDFLFIALGLVVLVSSIGGFKRALNLRAFGYPRWWAAMIPACAVCIVALSIIFFPALYGNMVMIILGIVLAVEAVSDLLSIRRLSRLAREVDAPYTVR